MRTKYKEQKERTVITVMKTLALVLTLIGNLAMGQVSPIANTQLTGVPVMSDRGKVQMIRKNIGLVTDRMVQFYGHSDFTQVQVAIQSSNRRQAEHAASHGESASQLEITDANQAAIFVSLGNSYLYRYLVSKNFAELDQSLKQYGWVVDSYESWGGQWSSAPTMAYLANFVRFAANTVPTADTSLLWDRVKVVLAEEANNTLRMALPFTPFDSSPSARTGDTKAEEDMWEATVLTAAAVYLPNDPNATAWETKARELAYDAITRPSDAPDALGIKTATVSDEFTLINHWTDPNAFYTGGTLFLRMLAVLPYRLEGLPVPAEFNHNVVGLYGAYRSYVGRDASGTFFWTTPQDLYIPGGDPSAFLLPGLDDLDAQIALVRQKVAQGYLWSPGTPPSTIDPANDKDILRVVMDTKVVWYYTIADMTLSSAH